MRKRIPTVKWKRFGTLAIVNKELPMNLPDAQERLRILRELDIDAALKLNPYKPPGGINEMTGEFDDQRKVVLAGLHKARLMCPKRLLTKEQREDSLLWLMEHGYKREIYAKR